ncbi:hypothetical protein [Sphingomonas quercus]|uniref:Uncharacterized protein n=1 Tax=Sphingomonas quercus TaxID=2842451 RepID=A0ABS6BHF7_9SPHN|nr:hypothetical protein [Sphingomonas quercus]MBU3077614.1 hypothetical protein [Sphingomonas quercus]
MRFFWSPWMPVLGSGWEADIHAAADRSNAQSDEGAQVDEQGEDKQAKSDEQRIALDTVTVRHASSRERGPIPLGGQG